MKFISTIQNVKAKEWNMNISQAYLFSWIYELPSWAEKVLIGNDCYYFASRNKAIKELPLLPDKKDTVYRYYKQLEKKELIEVKKIDGKDYIALTEKGKEWNTFDELGNKSDYSEINPTQLGNKSESNSEINPTDNNIIIYNNTSNNKEKNNKKRNFEKPSVSEVAEYCHFRNNGIDAEAFWDFYESKDWKIGKNKMKDWKACVRTWERNSKKESSAKEKKYGRQTENEIKNNLNPDLWQ